MIEHAIQLRFVAVKELHLETFWPIPNREGYEPAQGVLQFSSSPFNAETETLQVRLKFISGRDFKPSDVELDEMKAANEQPFHLRAEVVGEFHVDVTQFSPEKLPKWAKGNAPLVLLPFLRELVFTLSSRSGSEPLILPMMLVPTLVKESPEGGLGRSRRAVFLGANGWDLFRVFACRKKIDGLAPFWFRSFPEYIRSSHPPLRPGQKCSSVEWKIF